MAKKLHKSAPTIAFVRQGSESATRLRKVPECAPLADPLQAQTTALDQAYANRVAAEKAVIPWRVECSFADYTWDETVRSFAKISESHGGRKSPLYRELLPDGIGPLVTPSGESQLRTADQLLARFDKLDMPEAVTLREEWRPKLKAARDAIATALEGRKAAENALYSARQEEAVARRNYSRTIDKTIAEVRALFPENRRRQNLFFPSLDEYGAVDSGGETTESGTTDSTEVTE